MGDFFHRLAQEWRAREQYLEDHNEHPLFDTPKGCDFRIEYDDLMVRLNEFVRKVEDAAGSKEPFDLTFKETIEDENRTFAVELEAWQHTFADV